jgi:hypothetical protein
MKPNRIALFVLALLILGGFTVLRVNARNEPEYDITLGNGLSDITYEPNRYIDIPDKPVEVYDITIPDSFDLMAEDAELELYLERETLAIAVRVKDNGYVYASYNFDDSFAGKNEAVVNPIKSGITLDLYKDSTPVSVSYMEQRPIATGELVPAAISGIQSTDNGFHAFIDFNHPEIMIRFELTVSIVDGALEVHIPGDSIAEYNPNLFDNTEQYYLLRNIVLFPYFGSTKGEDDGYVVLPDGSGALIELDKTPLERSSFSLNVYGQDFGYRTLTARERSLSTKDFQRVTLPMFGIVHDAKNTGFYVSVEEGDYYSVLNYKSGGVINDYYYTYFAHRYRESYEQYQSRTNEDQYRISFQDIPNEYDVSLRYSFLSGADATYVGIAKAYRDDLIARNLFPEASRGDFSQTPLKIDMIGQEVTLGILRPVLQEVTRYDEVVQVLKTLQNDGYTELITTLQNFDLDTQGYRFDISRKLGGRGDFRDMLEELDAMGVPFSYYLDYVRTYNNRSRDHAQTLSKREIFYIELSWVAFVHFINDPALYREYAEEDIEDLAKYGIDRVSLAGLDRAVHTTWDDRIVYAQENQARVEAMLDTFQDASIRMGLEQPDKYLFPYMNAYYNAPISSSDFTITAASIPFLQLVLGGSVDFYSPHLNYISDETYTLLRMVEFGIFPAYMLTGGSTYDLKQTNSSNVFISEYDVMQTRMRTYYDMIDDGLSATIGKEMVNHRYLAAGVVEVTYDDDTVILLNYNRTDALVGTTTVPAEGYVVIP